MINRRQTIPTIYVADDDPDDRDLLIHAFQQLTDKHHVKAFTSGKALIKLLSRLPDSDLPCLIVLDYNMPELDGKQTLKYLQDSLRFRKIPKVIYTTSSSFVEKAEFLSLGAREFITKATTILGILNAVKIMLSYCDNKVEMTA